MILSNISNNETDFVSDFKNSTASQIVDDAVKYARVLALSVIIPAGILFNTIAAAVFIKNGVQKSVATFYFFTLACADNSVLIGEILYVLITKTSSGYITDVTNIDRNIHACRCFAFWRYFSRLFSSWLVVAICLDRFIIITYPLNRSWISTLRKAKAIVFSLICISLTLSSPSFVFFGINQHSNHSRCGVTKDSVSTYIKWTIAVMYAGEFAVPSATILVFNILIIRKLKGAFRRRRQFTARREKIRDIHKENQMTVALVAVSLAFITLRSPYAIMYGLYMRHYVVIHQAKFPHFLNCMYSVYVFNVINYTINFFLYMISGQRFRQQFVNFICCTKSRKRGVVSGSSSKSSSRQQRSVELTSLQ